MKASVANLITNRYHPPSVVMVDGRPINVPTQSEHAKELAQAIRMTGVLEDIGDERTRQNNKWGIDQAHPDDTCQLGDDHYELISKRVCELKAVEGTITWRNILNEEVAEAYNASGDELELELVQVAAVCVSWIEDLRRRRERAGRHGITSGSRRNGMDVLRAMQTPEKLRRDVSRNLSTNMPSRWKRWRRRGA